MKKLSIIVVCVIIVLSLSFGLVACNKNKPEPTPAPDKILVYTIGDSIAEAIAGPSPMNERENYGYYALLGKGNDFKFINRAVSGYKTDQLLDLLNVNEDVGGPIDYTLLKTADVIQLSILGNDLLQQNLGILLCELGEFKKDVEAYLSEKEGSEQTISIDKLAEYARLETQDKLEEKFGESEDISTALDKFVKALLYTNTGNFQGGMGVFRDNSTKNYAAIIERIKEVNPDALLICQTIYNPVFDTAILIRNEKVQVEEVDGKYEIKLNDAGQSIVDEVNGKSVRFILKENYGFEPDDYRAVGDILIEMLNNVVRDYLAAHPGAFELVEIHDAFEKVYQDELANDPDTPISRRLYAQDYVHPSNEGHALIATLTQEILVAKGFGNNDSYIKSLKEIRCEQLDRMYSYNGTPVNVADAKTAINAGTTAQAVNDAYFNAITLSNYKTDIHNRASVTADGIIKAQFFYPWVMPNYANNIK